MLTRVHGGLSASLNSWLSIPASFLIVRYSVLFVADTAACSLDLLLFSRFADGRPPFVYYNNVFENNFLIYIECKINVFARSLFGCVCASASEWVVCPLGNRSGNGIYEWFI